ncbi:MAG: DUF192 domain-containing protein [Halobacteriales archaeon SW_9_67_25]|nr:MAG: DUF192 domain-containing protein [Halobacteriales archaeon SW_9_67_25]
MRVVHEPADGDQRVLATDIEVAESTLTQARGLMFRRSVPEDFALVMDLGDGGLVTSGPARQVVHMLFVRFPIDIVWLVDDEVSKTARLSPWSGIGLGRADRIVEFPAGTTEEVAVGDLVRTVEE